MGPLRLALDFHSDWKRNRKSGRRGPRQAPRHSFGTRQACGAVAMANHARRTWSSNRKWSGAPRLDERFTRVERLGTPPPSSLDRGRGLGQKPPIEGRISGFEDSPELFGHEVSGRWRPFLPRSPRFKTSPRIIGELAACQIDVEKEARFIVDDNLLAHSPERVSQHRLHEDRPGSGE